MQLNQAQYNLICVLLYKKIDFLDAQQKNRIVFCLLDIVEQGYASKYNEILVKEIKRLKSLYWKIGNKSSNTFECTTSEYNILYLLVNELLADIPVENPYDIVLSMGLYGYYSELEKVARILEELDDLLYKASKGEVK